jgi:hypothetical protein
MGRFCLAYASPCSPVDVETLVQSGDRAGERAKIPPILSIHPQKDVLEKDMKAGSSVWILPRRKGTCPDPYQA